MPHSLRVKIKGLRYKGIITDKDCERLCKALDNEDANDRAVTLRIINRILDECESHIDDGGCMNCPFNREIHYGDTKIVCANRKEPLEQIRDEIEKMRGKDEDRWENDGTYLNINYVLEVIDKYRGDKE